MGGWGEASAIAWESTRLHRPPLQCQRRASMYLRVQSRRMVWRLPRPGSVHELECNGRNRCLARKLKRTKLKPLQKRAESTACCPLPQTSLGYVCAAHRCSFQAVCSSNSLMRTQAVDYFLNTSLTAASWRENLIFIRLQEAMI